MSILSNLYDGAHDPLEQMVCQHSIPYAIGQGKLTGTG